MKLMTIYAHPADTITNCGGALARHADDGDEVVAVVLTHGGRIHPNAYAEEWRKEHPDEHVVAVARFVAERLAPVLMLAFDRTDSPGILVRPRRGRLEVGGEYLTGRQLRTAALVTLAVTRLAQERGARRRWPRTVRRPGPRSCRRPRRPSSRPWGRTRSSARAGP